MECRLASNRLASTLPQTPTVRGEGTPVFGAVLVSAWLIHLVVIVVGFITLRTYLRVRSVPCWEIHNRHRDWRPAREHAVMTTTTADETHSQAQPRKSETRAKRRRRARKSPRGVAREHRNAVYDDTSSDEPFTVKRDTKAKNLTFSRRWSRRVKQVKQE